MDGSKGWVVPPGIEGEGQGGVAMGGCRGRGGFVVACASAHLGPRLYTYV